MRWQIREIRVIDLILYLILPLYSIAVEISGLLLLIRNIVSIHPVLLVAIMTVPFYFSLKYFAIGCVLAYKAFAPLSLRDRCRYEPCCSTYMIIAIKKYGLFRGLYKGIRRIMRCKPPFGGEDMP